MGMGTSHPRAPMLRIDDLEAPYHSIYNIAVFGEDKHVQSFGINGGYSSSIEHIFGSFIITPYFQNLSKGLSNQDLYNTFGKESVEYPIIIDWSIVDDLGPGFIQNLMKNAGKHVERVNDFPIKCLRAKKIVLSPTNIPSISRPKPLPFELSPSFPHGIPFLQISIPQTLNKVDDTRGRMWTKSVSQQSDAFKSKVLPFYGLRRELCALPDTFNGTPYHEDGYNGQNSEEEIFNQFTYPNPTFFRVFPTIGYALNAFHKGLHIPHFIGSIILIDCTSSRSPLVIEDYIKQTTDQIVRGGLIDYFNESVYVLLMNASKLDSQVISEQDVLTKLIQKGFKHENIHFALSEMNDIPDSMNPNHNHLPTYQEQNHIAIERLVPRDDLDLFLRLIWEKIYSKLFDVVNSTDDYNQSIKDIDVWDNLTCPAKPTNSLIYDQIVTDIPITLFGSDITQLMKWAGNVYCQRESYFTNAQLLHIRSFFTQIYSHYSKLFNGYPHFPPLVNKKRYAQNARDKNDDDNNNDKDNNINIVNASNNDNHFVLSSQPTYGGLHPWSYAPIGQHLYRLLESNKIDFIPYSLNNNGNDTADKNNNDNKINADNDSNLTSLILSPTLTTKMCPYPDLYREQFRDSVWNTKVEMYYPFPFQHQKNPLPVQYQPGIVNSGYTLPSEYYSSPSYKSELMQGNHKNRIGSIQELDEMLMSHLELNENPDGNNNHDNLPMDQNDLTTTNNDIRHETTSSHEHQQLLQNDIIDALDFNNENDSNHHSTLLPFGELPTKYEFESFLLWDHAPLISDPQHTWTQCSFYPLHSHQVQWILNPSHYGGINAKKYSRFDRLQRALLLSSPFFHRFEECVTSLKCPKSSTSYNHVLFQPYLAQKALLFSQMEKIVGNLHDKLFGERKTAMLHSQQVNSIASMLLNITLNQVKPIFAPIVPLFSPIAMPDEQVDVSYAIKSLHHISTQLSPFHTRSCWIYGEDWMNSKHRLDEQEDIVRGSVLHDLPQFTSQRQDGQDDPDKPCLDTSTTNTTTPTSSAAPSTLITSPIQQSFHNKKPTQDSPQINMTYSSFQTSVKGQLLSSLHNIDLDASFPFQAHPLNSTTNPNSYLHGVFVIPFVYINKITRDLNNQYGVVSPSTDLFSQTLSSPFTSTSHAQIRDTHDDVSNNNIINNNNINNNHHSNAGIYPTNFIPPPIPSFFVQPYAESMHTNNCSFSHHNGFHLPAELIIQSKIRGKERLENNINHKKHPNPLFKQPTYSRLPLSSLDHGAHIKPMIEYEDKNFEKNNPITTSQLFRPPEQPFTSLSPPGRSTFLSQLNCPITIIILCLNPVVDDPVPYRALYDDDYQHLSPPNNSNNNTSSLQLNALEPITKSQYRYFQENIPVMYHHQVVNTEFFPFFIPRRDVHEKINLLWEFKFIHIDNFTSTFKQAEDNAIAQRLRIYRHLAQRHK